ncbi:hypothetical protein MNBD_PLANCTO02-1755 [hydrothermal vent metagenome]|uniref:Uncharacterized protein n=1 Tax=hydrothermal vent metagenome TaxID=652676 RepID=A0A3B1DRM9_9ZZZZ
MRYYFIFYLLLGFVLPVSAQKKGETIVVIAPVQAKLRMSNNPGEAVPRGNHLRVEDINGDWFWVQWNGNGKYTQGWIARSDVMPLEPFDKVIDFYTTAIQQKTNMKDYVARGLLWSSKGKYDAAITDYNKAIQIDPRQSDAWNNRGNAWRYKKEYNKAIKNYSEAIRLDPKDANVWRNRGNAWRYKKEYNKAIKNYSEAIRLDPKDASAWNSLAWLRATCPNENFRDGVQAVKEAKHACQITEWKNATYIDTYAVALAEVRQFGKAIKQIEKAMTLSARYAKEEGPKMLKLFKEKHPYRKE